MSAGTATRSAYTEAGTATRSAYAEAVAGWDSLPETLSDATYAAILESLTQALRRDDVAGVRASLGLGVSSQTIPGPVHVCTDESVKGLEGWTFDGWRCRYCLRRTSGPDYILEPRNMEAVR